jgi:hypothetical protein
MPKNVTGGIILLLGGSALIALAASDKGRYILDVLTNRIGPGAGSSSSGGGSSPASGFGGFGGSSSAGAGTGLGGSASSGVTSVAAYKKILSPGAFVGEKAAIPI